MSSGPEKPDRAISSHAPTTPKVLVVEDDPCAALLCKILLEKEGYQVEHCLDGEAGLQAFARQRFDAVILDLMMPKIDGMQVLKSIRSSSSNPLVPVIILTAARLKVVEEVAAQLGAKLYLEKTEHDKMIKGLREIMAERAATNSTALRMASAAPIEPRRPGTTPRPAPAAEKAAPPTGFSRFFRRNVSD